MKKLYARWVLCLLTFEQKQCGKDISETNLMFNHSPVEFLLRFITTDETWVNYYTPESKEHSRQCIEKCQAAIKKEKMALSFKKVMATIFWKAHGIMFNNRDSSKQRHTNIVLLKM